MITKINVPNCYKSFAPVKPVFRNTIAKDEEKPSIKLKTSVLLGAGLTTLGAVSLLAKHQSKLTNKKVNIFNVNYDEINVQMVALASLFGGTATGIIVDDKKYKFAKLKEGFHQAIANILTPMALLLPSQYAYKKIQPHIKLPQLKSDNIIAKTINQTIKIAPAFTITAAALISGVFLGTKISNKIIHNDTSDNMRKVKPLDFIYHPDDVATALVLSDKNGSIQKTVGHLIPPIFTICGYEAGIKR